MKDRIRRLVQLYEGKQKELLEVVSDEIQDAPCVNGVEIKEGKLCVVYNDRVSRNKLDEALGDLLERVGFSSWNHGDDVEVKYQIPESRDASIGPVSKEIQTTYDTV